MWQKIKDALAVLQVGKQFKDSAFWKNFQGASNGVLIVLGFLLTFFPSFQISQEALQVISMAIAYIGNVLINHEMVTPEMVKVVIAAGAALVLALFNNYFTYGTSAKVGLPAKTPPAQLPDKSEATNHEATKSVDFQDYGDGTFMESHSLPSYGGNESKPTVPPDNSVNSGAKGLLSK